MAIFDGLLRQFEKELSFVRSGFELFKQAHGSTASKVKLNQGVLEDPNVSRLIESFAWLSAKTQVSIDELKYRHLSEYMSFVSPNMMRELPSFLEYGLCDDDFNKPFLIEKGSVFETGNDQVVVSYSILSDIWCTPLRIVASDIEHTPFTHSQPEKNISNSCLRVTLRGMTDEVSFEEALAESVSFQFDSLRKDMRLPLDRLVESLLQIVVSSNVSEEMIPIELDNFSLLATNPAALITPLEENEVASVFVVKEFLSCKSKTKYFDLKIPFIQSFETADEIYLDFYFDMPVDLFMDLGKDLTVHLNRGIAVNLFKLTSEPVRVDMTESSYAIIPDASVGSTLEVYSIIDVYKSSLAGDYRVKKLCGASELDFDTDEYWSELREVGDSGSLVVKVAIPINAASSVETVNATLYAEILCFDRESVKMVSANDVMESAGGFSVPVNLKSLTASSNVVSKAPGAASYSSAMRVTTFSLLELLNHSDPLSELQSFLYLLSGNSAGESPEIDSLKELHVDRSTAAFRIDGKMVFVPGLKLKIVIDNLSKDCNYHLFSQVLNEFLRDFLSYDRFLELTVCFEKTSTEDILFPAALGSRLCL